MKERPILFSSDMVRAILNGQKTQTRRVIKSIKGCKEFIVGGKDIVDVQCYLDQPSALALITMGHLAKVCSFGQPGDQLWVRETFAYKSENEVIYKAAYDVADGFGSGILDFKTGNITPLIWRPSIHMPRWASRINLVIKDIRVESLQDISEKKAKAEGVIPSLVGSDLNHLKYRAGFQTLWDSINAKRGYGWDVNPWVWVIEFERV